MQIDTQTIVNLIQEHGHPEHAEEAHQQLPDQVDAGEHIGPLRIALLCPPWFPVPPPSYGGIEAVVALLADRLVELGHDVTLFAAAGSATRANLVAVDQPSPEQIGQMVPELRHTLACLRRAGEFDVISDHTAPLGCALSAAV